MKKINRFLSRVVHVTSVLSSVVLIAIVIFIVIDVFLRKVFNAPITGSYEVVQYMLMIVVFSAFCMTQEKRGHVRVTLVLNKLPWRVHCVLAGIFELACAVMTGFLCYAAVLQAEYLLRGEWLTDVLKFPMDPFFWAEAVFLLIFALLFLMEAIAYFCAVANKDDAEALFKYYV